MAIILIHESVFLSVVFRLLVFLHIEMCNGLEGVDNLYELGSLLLKDFISSCIFCIALGHFMAYVSFMYNIMYLYTLPPHTTGLELPGDWGDIVAFGRLTSLYASSAAKSKSLYFIRSRSVNYWRRSVK